MGGGTSTKRTVEAQKNDILEQWKIDSGYHAVLYLREQCNDIKGSQVVS